MLTIVTLRAAIMVDCVAEFLKLGTVSTWAE